MTPITTLFIDIGGVLLTNGWDSKAQVKPEQVVYIEDRPMFVEVAQALGINGIIHVGHDATQKELAKFGLVLPG